LTYLQRDSELSLLKITSRHNLEARNAVDFVEMILILGGVQRIEVTLFWVPQLKSFLIYQLDNVREPFGFMVNAVPISIETTAQEFE